MHRRLYNRICDTYIHVLHWVAPTPLIHQARSIAVTGYVVIDSEFPDIPAIFYQRFTAMMQSPIFGVQRLG